MRVFLSLYKDRVTGYQMVLADASYNTAMEWLQSECKKHGVEIFRVERDSIDAMKILVGKPVAGTDCYGQPEVWYQDQVTFYYDEDRGYLLKE